MFLFLALFFLLLVKLTMFTIYYSVSTICAITSLMFVSVLRACDAVVAAPCDRPVMLPAWPPAPSLL